MVVGHDEEAGYATTQVANKISSDGALCFKNPVNTEAYVRHVKRDWPIPDGLIEVKNSTSIYTVALEYKRPNEGVHGILTAIGQALSYIQSGFAGTVIVVPEAYPTLDNVGKFTKEVLEKTCKNTQIGILTYEKPDLSLVSPFQDLMTVHKPLELDNIQCHNDARGTRESTSTQWAFVREGETTPDTIWKMLKTYRIGTSTEHTLNPDLVSAVKRISDKEPYKYLSNAPKDEKSDQLWREFWFKYVLTTSMQEIWSEKNPEYKIGEHRTELMQYDTTKYRTFMGGRADSTKNTLVRKLNNGEITEEKAWEEFARKINSRAHSFRETIDSGLEAFGFLEGSEITFLGHQFVQACDRNDNPDSESVKDILRYALLKKGMFAVLLHYIFRLSEEKFRKNPLEFSEGGQFKQDEYLGWLETNLKKMHVMKVASRRSEINARRILQAERTIMKKLGLVTGDMRIGTGIVINWPKVNESLQLNESMLDLT